MKKLLLTLVIALSTLVTANAQEVGQFWMGGAFGFWSSKVAGGGESLTNYQLLPEIGYAVNDDTGVGIRFGYKSIENIETDGYYDKYYKERQNIFLINPFVRWSFLKGHFGGLFLDSGISYSYGTIDDSDYNTQEIEVGFRPGVALNVSRSVSLIGKFGFMGYVHNKSGVGGNYDVYTYTNSFGIDFDMSQFLLGAIIKF